MIKELFSLLLIAAACGAALHTLNETSAAPIAHNRSLARLAFLNQVNPNYTLPADPSFSQGRLPVCNQLTLATASVRGYGGELEVLGALAPAADGHHLTRLVVTRHRETPGIGDFFQTTHPHWFDQFHRYSDLPERAEIQAVSGATITGRAITQAADKLASSPVTFSAHPCLDQ